MNKLTSLMAALVVSCICTSGAQAIFSIQIQQVGNNVVATGNGEINIAGLTKASSGTMLDFFSPSLGFVELGGPSTSVLDNYSPLSGPTAFGSGQLFFPSSTTGDPFVLRAGFGVSVPTGYVSETYLSDSATYSSQTFTSLGITPGIYTFTFGSGANVDSVILNASVPEPATLLGVAVGGIAVLARRRRRAGARSAWDSYEGLRRHSSFNRMGPMDQISVTTCASM